MLHTLCIGVHPNSKFGWSRLLVSDMTNKRAGWLYTGKSNSKGSFYRDIYCKRKKYGIKMMMYT